MPDTALWGTIHQERRALAADLCTITDDQWLAPSACAGWAIRDVLAHMTAVASMNPPQFIARLVTSGFRFTRVQSEAMTAELGQRSADTLARFEAEVNSSRHPPGPAESWLGETIVHAEDIRRPLGLRRTYPTEAMVRLAEFYRSSNLIIGAKRRVGGVRLVASDTEWSSGEGPVVSGPLLALVLAMTGRCSVLNELSGEGIATLQSRL